MRTQYGRFIKTTYYFQLLWLILFVMYGNFVSIGYFLLSFMGWCFSSFANYEIYAGNTFEDIRKK